MESWRVSMIPIIGDSSGGNGSVAIVISDPSPRTSSSFTIKTIATVALKAKPLHSLSKKRVIPQSYRPQNLDCRRLITFRTERSLSSVSSVVTRSWIFSESILSFLKALSILTSEPKSLLVYIKFMSTLGMIWLSLSHINYQHGLPQILKMSKRCIDTS